MWETDKKMMSDSITSTKVLIIGGGPAGSSCAIKLRKLGIDCVLAEKARFPRVKLCGGMMTLKTKKALRDLLGDDCYGSLLSESRVSVLHSFTIYQKLEKKVSCNPKEPMELLDRPKMDYFLFRHAASLGCKTFDGDALSTIDFKEKIATFVSGKQIKYEYLVASDGASSHVERLLRRHDSHFKPKNKCAAIVELDIKVEDIDVEDTVGIYLGIVPCFYSWVFPKGNTVSIGLGKPHDKNYNMKAELRKFMQLLGVRNMDSYEIRGCMLPMRSMLKKSVWCNHVFFVGDAAGLVDPLTGEGICYAIASGSEAAKAMSMIITKSGDGTAMYEKALLPMKSIIRKAEIIQRAFSYSFILDIVCKRAKKRLGFMNFFYDEFVDKGVDESYFQLKRRWRKIENGRTAVK